MSEHTKCKKHRQYKVILKPRADCVDCWKMYAEKAEARLAEAERLLAEAGNRIARLINPHTSKMRAADNGRKTGEAICAFLEQPK